MIRTGAKPDLYEESIHATFNSTLYNPAVFSTPGAPGCLENFKQFFCGQNFPLCSGRPAGCAQACLNANKYCGLQESHVGLYDCSKYTQWEKDSTGDCPKKEETSGVVGVCLSMIVVILALFL